MCSSDLIAARLDTVWGDGAYGGALAAARAALADPSRLPSARLLDEARTLWRGEFTAMIAAMSQAARRSLLGQPLPIERSLHWAALAARSLQEQDEIEAGDQGRYEDFLAAYLDPARLTPA